MTHIYEFRIFCRLISRAIGQVKYMQNMRSEENIGYIVRGKPLITNLLLKCKIPIVC